MNGKRALVTPNGAITFPDIDYGNGSRPLFVAARNLRTLVVKIPGSTGWAGIGNRSYAPAYFAVFDILDTKPADKSGTTELRLDWRVDVPLRGK